MDKQGSKFLFVSFTILFLSLMSSGCGEKEVETAENNAAYVVRLADENDDGFPDGWQVTGTPDDRDSYEILLDLTTGHDDDASLFIQSIHETSDGFGAAMRTLPNVNNYKGTRLQLSGYIKTEDVSEWAGLWFRVDGTGRGNTLAFDNMIYRGPSGTTNWQLFTLVLDVPKDTAVSDIYYGFLLAGEGKAWVDEIQFEIVDDNVPLTDLLLDPQYREDMGLDDDAESQTETAVTQQAIFHELWQTVNDNYVYPDFNGADWQAIQENYQAQLADAKVEPDAAFYALMAEMIAELNDDHSSYLSPEEAVKADLLYSDAEAYVGVGIGVYALPSEEALLVNFTFPDGPAAQAGLQPHDLILAADGNPVCCNEAGGAFSGQIEGAADTMVLLTVQTPNQAPREVEVMRAPISGNVSVISQVIDGRYGYISIPTFWDLTIGEQVEAAWREMSAANDLKGLVIDLRTNAGGDGSVLTQLLTLFTDGELGQFKSRSSRRPLIIQGNDIANSQTIPLIILIGEYTESYAEVFAGILQQNGRATLIGSTTVGNVETIYPYDFADGSRAWIAGETFSPVNLANWEQTGIIPDIEVNQLWHTFATVEDDKVLSAAIEQMQ